MRRELSSARPETAGQTAVAAPEHRDPTGFAKLATRKFLIGTAATAALAAATGLGVAAPAMTNAADSAATARATAAATTAAARAAASTAVSTAVATAAATAAAAAAAGQADTPATNLKDLMNRTVASGLGSADIGGAWSPWGATFSVTPGTAHMSTSPGASSRATLEGVQAGDEALSVTFAVPTVPTSGSGSYFGLTMRRQSNGDALYARVKVAPGGVWTLQNKLMTGSSTVDVGAPTALPGTLVAGRSYVLDAVVSGGSSASVKSRVYQAGTPAPGFQVAGTITVGGGLGVKGSMGIYSYASSSGTRFDVDVDALAGQDLTVTTPPSTDPSSPSSTPTTPSSTPTSPSSTPTTPAPTGSGPAGGIGFATGSPSSDPTSTPPTSTPPGRPGGKPGPDNTGPVPGISLRVVTPGVDFPGADGILTPTAGQVLENLDIHGMVRVNQPDVVIRNCIIRGATVTDGSVNPRPMVDALAATNLQIIDSELAPSVRSYNNSTGINGQGYSLTRVDVHGSIDGVQVDGSNVRITDSWIHDTSWFAQSPDQHWTPSHNDGMQIFGGANVVVTGSTVEGTTNSVLQTSPTPGLPTITGMAWSDNWLDGGACSMNINAMSFPSLAPIVMSGNRFGNHQSISGCAIIADLTKTPLLLTANVWDANDQLVAVHRG